MIHAQEQARIAIRILRAMPPVEKKQKFRFVNWDRITELYGVIITPDAEPHASVDQREVPALTYETLCWRFRPRDFRSPSRFWRACVERPWQAAEIRVSEGGHRDVRVGDLTYRLPRGVVDLSTDKI